MDFGDASGGPKVPEDAVTQRFLAKITLFEA